ncbi:DNA excision repair protein Rad2 [Talaromyces stipitatus ATCC 10500]|uniref:DNA excision repair protein Rad2 n=1 Tax=Talaromyces stipitatus (strain ATCC 10500 / CBS 375.48 / QM 6759 / NRRL 1006) TaxID=441959 RepID=B8MH02_TALSN|nr:DNA excision repair protein Rad2 [Talaromyces stipitatus ATCC 10500]EED16383.1 DNA excision repair protein Rad2 [Talaromyces stipitatus ATCC 10500]
MGVTGLWTVVQPCARPVKLETLNRKRLAVDASIWIYQFLKAVRDKEGNALRNAHVVGFFRRICKLLFFGIKPVFVFDGGAPILKRQTIAARKKRREGRREDAVRTAGKLLAIQLQRRAEEEQAKRTADEHDVEEQEPLGEPNYVDEILMTPQERRRNRKFRKQDQYHLPDLETGLDQMGAPDDPRIMSQEELEEYARQFHNGEDINMYDFSKIDFDSPFFMSLPATDRYNILNAARIRSRLRMGYSKEQLDSMFPDRMAFSKFQIERVKERNDLTQRLMNLNGMNGADVAFDFTSGRRIAGERGKEYVLVKNPDVEGGWALGVVGNKEGTAIDRPIDVDKYGLPDVLPGKDDEDDDDDDAFEDVPIEGLNRLPRLPFLQKGVFDEAVRRQATETMNRRNSTARRHAVDREEEDEDALFFSAPGDTDDLFVDNEDEDLQKAIAMSLEPHQDEASTFPLEDSLKAVQAPHFEHEGTPESGDDMDFTAALARSKQSQAEPKLKSARPEVAPEYKFSGPLPFESLKINKRAKEELPEPTLDDEAGGFEKQAESKQSKAKKQAAALPPWFSKEDGIKQDFIADESEEEAEKKTYDDVIYNHAEDVKQRLSPNIIDVDELPDTKEVIDLDSDTEVPKEQVRTVDAEPITEENPVLMNDIAEDVRANPPNPPVDVTVPHVPPRGHSVADAASEKVVSDWEPTDDERETLQADHASAADQPTTKPKSPSPEFEDVPSPSNVEEVDKSAPLVYEHDAALFEEQDHTAVGNDDYSDPEEEDLMLQLAAETEEHARFVSEFNNKTQVENARDFEQELKQLRNQQRKDRRDADEVSQIMVSECQQLLRLFGLPYITAPMEAEAQCAELVSLGLVDGIVTDDSDTFLFGGTRVYKNMFNQSKFVECFLSSDLEKEYALDRIKLIQFAHLLGSDYTEGIPGVGPVTALEIITEFTNLEEFRDWWMQVQMGMEIPNDPHQRFRKKFKKMATKIFLPPSFPDRHIDEAYLHPAVDNDPSEFQWGVPDLNGLRSFLMATIGWSQERTDEVLVPVIRDMNKREQEGTQSNITRFMSGTQGAGAFAPRVRGEGKSRMDKAFGRLRVEAESRKRGASGANTTEPAQTDEDSGSTRKRRKKKEKSQKDT